jgi:glycosyltransferase involved in cell wall biosynthesis
MKKVLIVTYYWPPGSGAGVQRWLKFSKYLPQHGWEPVILTIDPAYATYPALDESLDKEVPSHLKVFKTKATDYFRLYNRDKSKIPSSGFAVNEGKSLFGWLTKFIRGNFFIPDPRKGWNRFAFRKACEIIENEEIRHVITTSPPHSTQLIGLKLKKKYPEIKWIADLRDPWTDIYYYNQFHPSAISRLVDSNYEKSVLKSADVMITVGKSLKELFASKIKGLREKIEVVTNGYDAEDFAGLNPAKPGIFIISYIGTLSGSYPVSGMLKALDVFLHGNADCRLKFVGMVSSEQREDILSSPSGPAAEFIPYTDHKTAIKYMVSSTVLLLIIPFHQTNKSIITGKLFEYLASGKPIICLGPVDGDAAGIIRETGHGETFDYYDSEGISDYIKVLISNPEITEKSSPSIYSRENLVKRVVTLLS